MKTPLKTNTMKPRKFKTNRPKELSEWELRQRYLIRMFLLLMLGGIAGIIKLLLIIIGWKCAPHYYCTHDFVSSVAPFPRAQGATYRCATHFFLFVTWRFFLSSPGQASFRKRLIFLFDSATRGKEALLLQLSWLEIPPPHRGLSGLGPVWRGWLTQNWLYAARAGTGSGLASGLHFIPPSHKPRTGAINSLFRQRRTRQVTRSDPADGHKPFTVGK